MTVGESLRDSSRKPMLPRGVPIEQEFPALLGPLLEGGTHPVLVLWHSGLPKWGHHQKGGHNILPWGDYPVTLVTRVVPTPETFTGLRLQTVNLNPPVNPRGVHLL